MKYLHFTLFLFLVAQTLSADSEYKRFSAELEGGAVWQSRNVVQIPNTSAGTRFSLVELVGKGPLPWVRLYLKWNITPKHNLHILLAPLFYTKTGTFDTNINYCGETFQQGIPTDATYKFNSWRLGYSYNLCKSQKHNCKCWIGFTAKIRDAKIRLEQQGRGAEKTDLGFVPLLHIAMEKKFSDRWGFVFDLEGLAGGPGRAFDGALKLRSSPEKAWSMSTG
ncbi:MAG: hypothetical protein N3A65_07100 [candidate division WOR-3 bacterium]|nr:hypothetical protein [candidate division WOR-3 bacterium]